MLTPAEVCRKKRILSNPDRARHQAPNSVELLATRSLLTVSTASCRHPTQSYFWLRGNSVLNEHLNDATRAALPEPRSCVDDLNNRQDQTPEFALISLNDLPPARRGKLVEVCPAGSLWSYHRGSKKEAVGER